MFPKSTHRHGNYRGAPFLKFKSDALKVSRFYLRHLYIFISKFDDRLKNIGAKEQKSQLTKYLRDQRDITSKGLVGFIWLSNLASTQCLLTCLINTIEDRVKTV